MFNESLIKTENLNKSINNIGSIDPRKDSNNNIETDNNFHSNLSFHFTNGKAGMEGLDREEIDRIIYEATKDSAITKKKMEDNEKAKLIVEDYKIKLDNLHKNEILFEQNRRLTETRVRELKKDRILNRTWMHIDMDMFYAAVEIRDNPDLKDKPIAVGSERMVATSNYVARKFGVRSAMPGFLAKKLCKDLVFVNPNFENYQKESRKIMDILRYYDSDIDICGLDEAYLDLTNYLKINYISSENEIKDLIKEIKNKIFVETKLTSSCGIACNKMLAKICSELLKPDGLYLMTNSEEIIEEFVRKLKVRKIPHVGEKLEKKLNLMDIFTCDDIIKRSVDLFHILSDNYFDFLLSSAYGIGSCYHEVVRESISKSISCSETFKVTNDIPFIDKIFVSLCKKLYQNMLEQSVIGKTLTIEITDKNEKHLGKSLSLNKKYETESELIKNGFNILKSMVEGTSIRLIRVKLGSLTQINPETFKKKEENSIKQWINRLQEIPNNIKHDNEEKKSVDRKKEEIKKSSPNKYGRIEEMFSIAINTESSKQINKYNSISNSNSTPNKKNQLKRRSDNISSSKKKKKDKRNCNKKSSKSIGPLDNFLIKNNKSQ